MPEDNSAEKKFTPDLPATYEKEKNTNAAKIIGKIIYWAMVVGLTIYFAPFLLLGIVCTAGLGLIIIIPLYILVFKIYRGIFKDY